MPRRSRALAILCSLMMLTSCAQSDTGQAPRLAQRMFAAETPDLVNPLRGQYENLLEPLYPTSSSGAEHPAWPGTRDVSARIEWRALQPRDPRTVPPDAPDDQRFEFGELDRAIESAANEDRRFGFRVTAFNSCCEQNYPNDTDISVPDWLTTIPGATRSYPLNGVNYVIPDWNSEAYLTQFTALLQALGRRYDRDERIALFEVSGYGDFSENHVTFMRDQLGLPGPEPEDSESRLGYYSQYRDQFITKAAIDTLVTANLAAFPNTQLITAPGNPEIVKQLFRDHPLLAARRKPVGIRADGLGVYSPIPTWAENEYSHYVKEKDPIVDVVNDRYRTAPIVTEWIPELSDGQSALEYYTKGLVDVVNNHVAMTASTGFPAQLSGEPMPQDEYDVWSKANKMSGYRFAVSAAQPEMTFTARTPIVIPLSWHNFGVSPVYEAWRPEYEVISEDGRVVRRRDAAVDLRDLVASQDFQGPSMVPVTASATDELTLPEGLEPGTYSIGVRVRWEEYKPRATHRIDFPPMQLELPGRDDSGSYPVTTFVVR